MPVLIKYNQATECCITNGAEGKVVDWIYTTNPSNGTKNLDTLFVELQNPAKPIQLPGLPPNVVPISKEICTIRCRLPDDEIVNIKHEQIPLIPNFAMTDFGSQGKTRLYNVIHLTHCRNAQSYYTCLSRSSSHAGTVILGDFDERKISGRKMCGFLRQEFRELEVLDDITNLHYNDSLPSHVEGHTRNNLISAYQE
jgi:hypothetical protein